jgi:hypothetical protein
VRKGSLAIVVAALLLASGAQAGGVDLARPTALGAYRGTGSWVSIYDTRAWRSPERVVATLAAHRVRTLYLETSNDRQTVDVVRPDRTARFLDAAHASGIAVVGWYLPSFTNDRRDVRRAVAGARFTSRAGNRFDAFALDVESTRIRSVARRTRRAVAFAAAVRRALSPGYPLGAITPDPVGARYWPRYPFAELARSVDVFLPMAYFTARTSGSAGVRSYTRRNVELIRTLAGNAAFPVHPIGGEAQRAPLREVRAFLIESSRCDTLGASLWEYGQMTRSQWRALSIA